MKAGPCQSPDRKSYSNTIRVELPGRSNASATIPTCRVPGGQHQDESAVTCHVLIMPRILAVTIEDENSLTLTQARLGVRILDGIDIRWAVIVLDPLFQVLSSSEVRRRVDCRAGLPEDPVVGRPNGPNG